MNYSLVYVTILFNITTDFKRKAKYEKKSEQALLISLGNRSIGLLYIHISV